jgi:nucleoside-diphosphate-sugar epimerase
MKRVLITGATGCVGRQVVPGLLARGWDVHAIVRRDPPTDISDVTWHRADLLDRQETERAVRAARASHLLHLAWYIAPGKWAAAPENFDWVTASMTLLRSFTAHGGCRVVTAGSCLEYDWAYGYCSEDRTPRAPRTTYGVCKNALQMLTAAMAGINPELSSAWGRIFFLYGPHEHPDRLVASAVRSLLAGKPALCSHGRQIRDYLYVQDVADAFVELLESDVAGPINVASGRPIALKDIVERIGQMLGRPELVRLGAIPQAATDVPLVVADMTAAFERLRWRPAHTIDQGLEKTIGWWRERMAQSEAVTWA